MLTWNQDGPSVISFSGTNGAGISETLTLAKQGAGPTFTATLLKNGSNVGSIIFDSIDDIKNLFGTVSNSLNSILN